MSMKVRSPSSASPPLVKNAAAAPVVYFDSVPVFGLFGGNVQIELTTHFLMPRSDGSVATDTSCVAHLRCSPNAASMLADALAKALDMLKQQQALQEKAPSQQYDGELRTH